MIRPATPDDIGGMQTVRRAVRENRLSDPSKVTDADVLHYITQRGMGWVYEADAQVVGFAIADMVGHNIWALFVLPGYEGKGIGRQLHHTMLHGYFQQTNEPVWLSTDAGTRAEAFYRRAGYTHAGPYGNHEVKFEMTKTLWQQLYL